VAHQSSVFAAFPFGERGRLSALHGGDFCSPGPRFLVSAPVCGGFLKQRLNACLASQTAPKTFGAVPSPASSSRRGRSTPRSGPEASRERGYVRPRPQAPHLAPSSKRLAKTPSAEPGKARQGKARQGKARQGKARQGKARQGKARLTIILLGIKSRGPCGGWWIFPYCANPTRLANASPPPLSGEG
jgi:hypothetical protein